MPTEVGMTRLHITIRSGREYGARPRDGGYRDSRAEEGIRASPIPPSRPHQLEKSVPCKEHLTLADADELNPVNRPALPGVYFLANPNRNRPAGRSQRARKQPLLP